MPMRMGGGARRRKAGAAPKRDVNAPLRGGCPNLYVPLTSGFLICLGPHASGATDTPSTANPAFGASRKPPSQQISILAGKQMLVGLARQMKA